MKWKVLREDTPGNFVPVSDDPPPANSTLVDGVAIYEDGYADDGSDWGDDESNLISAQQQAWQAADSSNRSFACSWVSG